MRTAFVILAFVIFISSCGSRPKEPVAIYHENMTVEEERRPAFDTLDFNRNIDGLNIQELRILRSYVYARHGYLFEESDLRDYWKNNTLWYDTLSLSRHKDRIPELSVEEEGFIKRIDDRITLLQQENYIFSDTDTTANILNIVNLFLFTEITQQKTMDELAVHNYAVVSDTIEQLFQVYQGNDTLRLPNFVTSDLFLQLAHTYHSFILRNMEQEHFIPLLADLCLSLYQAFMVHVNKPENENIKNIATYNAAFYAIPYTLLTGKQLKIPELFSIEAEMELIYVDQQEDQKPALLSFNDNFPYSAFKPYGHYTHTAAMRRYFKALKWLQLAPYCYDRKTQLQQAVFAALIINSAKNTAGEPLSDLYRRLSGSLNFFTGQPADFSLLDISDFLKKNRIVKPADALNNQVISRVNTLLKDKSRNTFRKYATGCRDGIWFLPQPYFPDGEILDALTDKSKTASRTFPKVADVFAVFGSQPAFDQLFLHNREDTLWTEYPARFAEVKDRAKGDKRWNASSYGKWMECLLALQQEPHTSQAFMNKLSWRDKIMETASASWIKLKHDALLYGKIPDYPEPPDTTGIKRDTLPPPVVMGYVEPNLMFWKSLREWVELTDANLKKYRLSADSLNLYTGKLHRYVSVMEGAVRKELKDLALSEEEYSFIAHIGDSIAQFTLSMTEPRVDRWEWTAGTDKSVAVAEKIYERNIPGDPNNGTGYAATGFADPIYVMVEINGFLYLTKGAVWRSYEWNLPAGTLLKEEDWPDILRKSPLRF